MNKYCDGEKILKRERSSFEVKWENGFIVERKMIVKVIMKMENKKKKRKTKH